MDYRDNRQRWAESHQVVHFYAGQWCTFTPGVDNRMLPGLDGLSMVRSLRAAECHTPTLFLSALGEVDDRVEGLRFGGDDYLVNRLLSRSCWPSRGFGSPPWRRLWRDHLRVGDLEIDLLTRGVRN